MDLVLLRLSTYVNGVEKHTNWSFTPLRNTAQYPMARESGNDGEGTPRRRPHDLREQRTIKLPASLLLNDTQWENFLRLLMAHKIEMQKFVNGKAVWVEYTLDVENIIDFDHPEDIDRLRSNTFKLVQSDPILFTDFEKRIGEVTNA